MRAIFKFSILLLFAISISVPAFAADETTQTPQQLGLTVRADGTLMKDGKPYRGIGVNYFDAFYRTLLKADDTSYEQGFKTLADYKIPLARIMGCGFWPVDNKLYLQNKELYFQHFDAVVHAAEKYHIGLIPSLFWNMATVPDMVGEPCDQWGNPASKTHEFMRTYIKEVVTRYRNSPAIWGWEFGNEYNLGADLPNAAEWRPPIHPELGTATSRSARDELTHDMIRTAFAAFAREVRKYDPYRIISTGNGFPRASAWHQRREKSWTKDTPEQYGEMLLGDNPDPISVISVHAYSEDERIKPTLDIAIRAHRPLFIGEFGLPGPRTDATEKQFNQTLSIIEQTKVPLAALWVYDFGHQDDFNVTANNQRAYQLQSIAEANTAIKQAINETHH
ncbi:MAG: cellulase family glycosylhydrolase [Abitibacteriaceae bacterium]|nr:cellulase family glycosylhydrolase [Abditibacteriaceae bacterium]